MTKVQIHFHLQRPLDDSMLDRLSGANSVYGIQKIKLDPSLDGLTVEYDATRLRPSEVENVLAGAGIPLSGLSR
jgi:hypothetical protein